MGSCWSRDEDGREEGLFAGEEVDGGLARAGEDGARVRLEGSSGIVSMHTQQGMKGVNQDAMVLWEDFGYEEGTVFCSVFDGHGPFGHKVSAHVRDNLPSNLSLYFRSLASPKSHSSNDTSIKERAANESHEASKDDSSHFLFSWKKIFTNAFEELDKELSLNTRIDCVSSGTTAVSIVKHREHLLVANLGDSRAILGTLNENNKLVPIQLTVDLKPNLPCEAERIKKCKGRVFALKEEPDVHRIWLADDACPGLAMARAFGDFCLKKYGLISSPQLSSWKLTEKDEFVVLATDGIWDVLSNKQVVNAVYSARNRADAAKLLVHRAVRTWRTRYPTSKIDDCTAICLFLKQPSLSSQSSYEGGSHVKSQ